MPTTCKARGCDGEISKAVATHLQTSCHGFSPAFPCVKCGLLHFENGGYAKRRSSNEKVFWNATTKEIEYRA